MDKLANIIVTRRKPLIAVFLLSTLLCLPLIPQVKVNYNIVDYLPATAPSTISIEVFSENFTGAVPNAQVLVPDVSIPQALEIKQRILDTEGVSAVMWLDDREDITKPLSFANPETLESFYKDGTALFQVTISGNERHTTEALQALVGASGAVGGEAPSMGAMQAAAMNEVLGAFAILLPAIILILVLATSSWIEPLLLLASIGVAIALNMGTNIVFGEVSFVTSSVSPILQMAVSLDFSIFLLHSFNEYREQTNDPLEAMRRAIKTSFSTVSACAGALFFGFIALVFMAFLIGADLGINLAKGIVFSFLSAIVFLPALTLVLYKVVDKARHRRFSPTFAHCNKFFSKLAIPVSLIALLAIVPAFLGQGQTAFLYGSEGASSGSRVGMDNQRIVEEFGKTNIMLVMVPRGDVASELLLAKDLESLEHVTNVMSYATTVSAEIPSSFLESNVVEQFYSKDYARLIVYTDTPSEGALAFDTVATIRSITEQYYPSEAYSMGRSTNLFDMKFVVEQDNFVVNLIAIGAIFLVLLLTFRSLLLPFILLLTIETAIWINLAIPYFSNTQINYIGYLVLSTVQLGATVDYAILLTNTYMRLRKDRPKKQALHDAMGSAFKPILVSASILALAGFALYGTSTNPIVCDIGLLLGRGTLLSLLLVVCFLPPLLSVFDPLIGRLTWRSRFFKEGTSS